MLSKFVEKLLKYREVFKDILTFLGFQKSDPTDNYITQKLVFLIKFKINIFKKDVRTF